jgi:hypothetical protein
MQDVMQRLPVRPRNDAGEFDERLVVLARQEHPNQVLAQRAALLEPPEQVVEGGTELVDRLGGRWGGFRGLRIGSSRGCPPTSLPPYHT